MYVNNLKTNFFCYEHLVTYLNTRSEWRFKKLKFIKLNLKFIIKCKLELKFEHYCINS